MANEWYYTLNGQQQPTPVSSVQLKQIATSGQLKPDDLVWQEGMANWAPAASVKGLFPEKSDKSDDRLGDRVATVQPVPLEEQGAVVESPVRSSRSRRGSRPPAGADKDNQSSGGLLALPPLVVFLLSLCTCGLFGWFYIYSVASASADRSPDRDLEAPGLPLRGRVRHPIGVIVLGYLTLGFYTSYWISQALQECADFTGRKDIDSRTELALMLVFPPYALFVAAFRLPELIRATQIQAQQPEASVLTQAPLFLSPFLAVGLPFLTGAYQDVLNRVWQKKS
jgi:hypothetical protein